ncbi:MAG: membrane dipeptidase [Coxiellaceae bacterium]|nr:membrane dipeptidase [Coxiellaceae bacterium]
MKPAFKPYEEAIIWDAHACPTLEVKADLSPLFKYKKSGFTYVSLNIGFGPQDANEILAFSKYIKQYISDHTKYFIYANTYSDILHAKKCNKLAIGLDLEGITSFLQSPSYIDCLKEIGIKQVGLVYNTKNQIGGGCYGYNSRLSGKGKEVVKHLNDNGIVIDCSHMGEKCSLDVMCLSRDPVIFSHSNLTQLHKHPRNISNLLIQECARNGGVVGINGISIFMNDKNSLLNEVVNNIEYVCSLVGDDHVGLGLDYVFDHKKTLKLTMLHPEAFPNRKQYQNIRMIEPTSITQIINELAMRKFSNESIHKILGRNFLRVAKQVWKK